MPALPVARHALRARICGPVILCVAALTACATPLERCLSAANTETRRLTAAIHRAEGNVARGYALHQTSEAYTHYGHCPAPPKPTGKPGKDGKTGHPHWQDPNRLCPETRYRTIETPVAIDVTAERGKLIQLRQTLTGATARARGHSDQCFAHHPPSG